MSRPPVVGAGLKMFLGYAETVRYLHELAASAEQFEGVSVFVLPSFPVLAAAQDLLSSSPVLYGAQDGHWEEAGPYTGCVSPAMLRELGCTFVEVGHAERRRLFHETDAVVARKAVAAARSGLTPIVCVGEERMGDPAHRVVAAQVVSVLESLPEHADLVIAYEPVWAIGAAAAAEPRHIEEVVSMVRELTDGRGGEVRVLYGGSVAPGGVAGVLATGVDGVFVARSALAVSDLRQVVESVREAA